jgi:hypothetical protein
MRLEEQKQSLVYDQHDTEKIYLFLRKSSVPYKTIYFLCQESKHFMSRIHAV